LRVSFRVTGHFAIGIEARPYLVVFFRWNQVLRGLQPATNKNHWCLRWHNFFGQETCFRFINLKNVAYENY
jgi:hypothetical protein